MHPAACTVRFFLSTPSVGRQFTARAIVAVPWWPIASMSKKRTASAAASANSGGADFNAVVTDPAGEVAGSNDDGNGDLVAMAIDASAPAGPIAVASPVAHTEAYHSIDPVRLIGQLCVCVCVCVFFFFFFFFSLLLYLCAIWLLLDYPARCCQYFC